MGKMKALWQAEQDRVELKRSLQQARNQGRYKRANEDAELQAEADEVHEFTDLVKQAEYRLSLGELLGD